MFGLFTKNLDTMKEATNKKKTLKELDSRIMLTQEEMGEFLGGNEKLTDIKKKRGFFGLFGPSPCQGELPQ